MQRNMVVFVILTIFIIAGWYWLATSLNPRKDSDGDPKKIAQLDKDAKKKTGAEKDDKDKDKDKDKKKKEKPKEKNEPKKDLPKIVEPKEPPAATETLGGDGFHLTVDITTLGAGVRRVVLNRFKAADWRGRPTDRELELIQDDEISPAFRMYHYLQPSDKNPVLGLGEKIWTFKGKNAVNDDDENVLYEEARYATMVPDMDIEIVKTYRLGPKDYHVTLLLEFHDQRIAKAGQEDTAVMLRYQLTGAMGLPIEGEWYTAIFRNALTGLVDPQKNVWRSLEDSSRISMRRGGDRFPESRGDNLLQYAGVANQYFGVFILPDDKQPDKKDGGGAAEKILAWARPTLETREKRGLIDRIDAKRDVVFFRDEDNKIFPYHLLPRTKRHFDDLELKEGQSVTLSFYETPEGKRIATWVRLGTTLSPQFDDITVRVNSEPISLLPGAKVAHQFMLYHGPVKTALLGQFTGEKEVPSELVERYAVTLHLRTLTDYPSDNFLGKISSFIRLTDLIIFVTRFMHWLLNLLHYVFGYGLSIVVLTVMVRGAMFPISRKQALFSIKMQELAPELKKIQEKYTEDPQAKMQATQEFYRKHGINPLGSCWPLFLQMPIFLGLYFALQESIHFRLADFLWIKNLAAPDMLIYWSESIPVISSPDHGSGFLGALYLGPYLNILPIIAVGFMMVQQIQTMPPPTDEQTAMQQKMLKYMTIFFGIMFYKVAAGLCIYFISSSLWGMAERKLLPKKKTSPGVPAPPGSSTSGSTNTAVAKGLPPLKDKGKWAKKEKEVEKTPVTTIEKLKALWKDILKAAEKK